MKKTIILTSALLVSGVLSAAEPGSNLSFKLRAQAGLETTDGVRNGFGVGLNYAIPVATGAFNVEVGYQYYAGKQFRQPVAGNTFGYTDTNSVDSRKDSIQGLAARIAYSQKINSDWTWQVGAAIAGLKDHHESIASFNGNGNWDVAVDTSAVSFSPYAGVRYDLDEIGALEFNVLIANYKAGTVEPSLSAAAVTPVFGTKTVTKPKFEIGYVFKF